MGMNDNQINVNIPATTSNVVNFSHVKDTDQNSSSFGYDAISLDRIALKYYNNRQGCEKVKDLKDIKYSAMRDYVDDPRTA